MTKNRGFRIYFNQCWDYYLERNFKRSELECPCCGKCEMRPELLTRLQALRDIVGFPLVITSGFRCEKHNKEVGGAPKSQHLIGKAVDISFRNMTGNCRYDLIAAAIALQFSGLGVATEFLHIDARGRKKRVIW